MLYVIDRLKDGRLMVVGFVCLLGCAIDSRVSRFYFRIFTDCHLFINLCKPCQVDICAADKRPGEIKKQ